MKLDPMPRQDVKLPPLVGFVARADYDTLAAEVAQLTAELTTVKAERDEARKQLSRLDARMDEALAPPAPREGGEGWPGEGG